MNTNLTKIIEQHRNYEKHKKNIKNIESSSFYNQDPKRYILMNTYKKQRQITDRHLKKEREDEVAKENDQILERINKIYNRNIKREGSIKRFKSEELMRRSALGAVKEEEEIERENMKIATRIIGSRSRMQSTKELRAKYAEHLKHKMRLSHFAQNQFNLKEKTKVVADKLIALQTVKSRSLRARTTKESERVSTEKKYEQ